MNYTSSYFVRIITFLLILLLIISITFLLAIPRNISNQVLRLHIIANSDSPYDQQLKLSVRDRILNDCEYIFKNASSLSSATDYAKEASRQICRIAEDEVRKQGFFYPVQVSVTDTNFPTKKYGRVTLPAGMYRAVRVEIGSSAGRNWWCVLYPPLCLTEGAFDVPTDSLDTLKENLSPREFEMITHPEKIRVKMKFKIIELLNNFYCNS